jgi:hypothetical protein
MQTGAFQMERERAARLVTDDQLSHVTTNAAHVVVAVVHVREKNGAICCDGSFDPVKHVIFQCGLNCIGIAG